jgi:hypothetical protein
MEPVKGGPNNPLETYMVPACGSETYHEW